MNALTELVLMLADDAIAREERDKSTCHWPSVWEEARDAVLAEQTPEPDIITGDPADPDYASFALHALTTRRDELTRDDLLKVADILASKAKPEPAQDEWRVVDVHFDTDPPIYVLRSTDGRVVCCPYAEIPARCGAQEPAKIKGWVEKPAKDEGGWVIDRAVPVASSENEMHSCIILRCGLQTQAFPCTFAKAQEAAEHIGQPWPLKPAPPVEKRIVLHDKESREVLVNPKKIVGIWYGLTHLWVHVEGSESFAVQETLTEVMCLARHLLMEGPPAAPANVDTKYP